MKEVKVRKSKIQGKGVYAANNIKKGEVVLKIDDSHIVENISKLTKTQYEFDCDYLASGKVVLMQPPERYINHSCDPSTYVRTVKGIRNVIAMHKIRAGDEITYDYSINGNNEGTFYCYCGSDNCRGVYQGDYFKLPRKLQIKYLRYLDDWFVKEHSEEIEALKKEAKNL